MSTLSPPRPGSARLTPFTATWLRAHCRCADCRDADSGQRLLDLADLPVDTAFRDVQETDEDVTVTFAPDGHHSTFPHAWLTEQRAWLTAGDGRTERGKRQWAAADLPSPLPRTAWTDYRDDPHRRAEVLRQVEQVGFAILTGTPTVDGTVAEIAATFGFVRETEYGRVFDVRVQPSPDHPADTGRALAPHTDNPYRDPVPTLQLLHCLADAGAGGDTGLVDGFHAAADLRRHDPDDFDILASTAVTFRRSDAAGALRADRPIIDVDVSGHIREVRFNHRAMAMPLLSAGSTKAFHAAYRRLAGIIGRQANQVWFPLHPGDCLILDNTRVLHARSAFTDAGRSPRHLQGCYADLDALIRTLTALETAS